MDFRYAVEILVVLLAYSMIVVRPVNNAPTTKFDTWVKKNGNNLNRIPQVKYVQLFNRAANSYVRIMNTTVDATTTNHSDPDTILQIDMFGPILMAVRSYPAGKYICYNPTTGYVEIKVISTVSDHPACLFNKTSNVKSYSSYRSYINQTWYLAFHGKGRKTGRPKKAHKTQFKNKGSMFLQTDSKKPKG